MKKIFLIGLVLCILSGCAIFRTRDVTISNNSDHTAYVAVTEFRRNGDLHGATGGSDYIELLPHTSTTYKLYDKGKVRLTKPNRNFLKKQSNELYEILNAPKKIVKVFNTTAVDVILFEENTLFDKVNVPKNEKDSQTKYIEIEVFTIDNFHPYAINKTTVYEEQIFLKTVFQEPNILVISF